MTELRTRDPQRWPEQIRQFPPGTRLFDAVLGALWHASQLDPTERAMVSQGLKLDDETAVHLSAQALLNANVAAVASGLSEVFAAIRTHRSDEKLWELALDAFARWSEPILSAPADEEPSPELRSTASEFLMLFRTSGTALSWDHGPHTRKLATTLAVFAVVVPHTLKAWMRESWSQDPEMTDGTVLATARLPEILRLIATSSAAAYWQKQFAEWTEYDSSLADVATQGLAELQRSPAP
jgi:hypothetical protein